MGCFKSGGQLLILCPDRIYINVSFCKKGGWLKKINQKAAGAEEKGGD